VPLRVKGGVIEEQPSNESSSSKGGYNSYFAASAGLGLRFWPNDSLSLDLWGEWNQGLNSASPGPLQAISFTGAQARLGVSWTSF
jgi:hypothetical protein